MIAQRPHLYCIIPARGGSTRIPRKNIKLFKGRPMINYAIGAARITRRFAQIFVTTDDDEIADVAEAAGALVLRRPPDDGTTGTQELAARILETGTPPHWSDGAFACVLYPCSPMLLGIDLVYAWARFQRQSLPFAVSCLDDGSDAGCFYFGSARSFIDRVPLTPENTLQVRVPRSRFIDINTPEDWATAERMHDALYGR